MRTAIPPSKPRPGTGVAVGHPLALSLQNRYLFNELSGTRLWDASGHNRHALLSGMDPTTDWVGSDRGGALDFDGVDDFAQADSGVQSQGAVGDFTMSVRFRTLTTQTNKRLIGLGSFGGTQQSNIEFLSATQMRATISGIVSTITPTATVTYSDGRWHHVAVTYNKSGISSGRATLYFDGQSVGVDSFGAALTLDLGQTLFIGKGSGAANLAACQIDDARVYWRCLAPSEVVDICSAPYADSHRRTVWCPDRQHARIEVEARLGGDWIDLTSDLMMSPDVDINYGIDGTAVTDVVASSGSMSFALNNSATNSAGLLGYYSPGHANCRANFDIGIEVRFGFVINGTRYIKFHGWLDSVDPIAGQHGERNTLCTALDWMNEAANFSPVIPTQINQRSDQTASTLVSAIEKSPAATHYDAGDSTFPYSFDNSQSEAQPALTELQKIAISEFGRIFVKGDTATGGVLCFNKRTSRLYPTVVGTYDDTMVDLSAPRSRTGLANRVKATLHPRSVDATPTSILFTNDGIPVIEPGATLTIVGYYTDPSNRESRVGGFEMVTPVATTDYLFNRREDGTGANMTSFFTVTAVYGGNSVEYTIVSSAATPVKCYMTKLQARGRGLYDYAPVDIELRDTASITAYGEALASLDMAYQNDASVAAGVARYVLNQQSTSTPNGATIVLVGDDDTAIEDILRIEPDTSLTITETVTGIAYTYLVNHVSLRVITPYHIVGEYTVVRGAVVGAYWTIGTSQLGVNTYVAPF